MKIWIYWSESNSWIYFYIVLNKIWIFFTGLNKVLLVLDGGPVLTSWGLQIVYWICWHNRYGKQQYTITALERDQYEVLWSRVQYCCTLLHKTSYWSSSSVAIVLLHKALFYYDFEFFESFIILKFFENIEILWNLKVYENLESFEILWKFRLVWNFKMFYHFKKKNENFQILWKFWNFMKILNFKFYFILIL
jgi:hypothetical protein